MNIGLIQIMSVRNGYNYTTGSSFHSSLQLFHRNCSWPSAVSFRPLRFGNHKKTQFFLVSMTIDGTNSKFLSTPPWNEAFDHFQHFPHQSRLVFLMAPPRPIENQVSKF